MKYGNVIVAIGILFVWSCSNNHGSRRESKVAMSNEAPTVLDSYRSDWNTDENLQEAKNEIQKVFKRYLKSRESKIPTEEQVRMYSLNFFKTCNELVEHSTKSSRNQLMALSTTETLVVLNTRIKFSGTPCSSELLHDAIISDTRIKGVWPLKGKIVTIDVLEHDYAVATVKSGNREHSVEFHRGLDNWRINPFGNREHEKKFDRDEFRVKKMSQSPFIEERARKANIHNIIWTPIRCE